MLILSIIFLMWINTDITYNHEDIVHIASYVNNMMLLLIKRKKCLYSCYIDNILILIIISL